LEDDEDAATETPEDSLRLEWWEEAERKAEEEEEEMLEEKEALLESFALARKEERTQAAAAQAVRAWSSPRGHGRIPAAAVSRQKIRQGCAHLEGRCGEVQGI
jgi:hypothetical protein